ncbi:MAG: adenylyltransferase/cytidyltransferase family protein, partial [Alistipes sp.]|nr:adenylyltransferase/cytidyltransferase family protein [Alistipes sp.]
MQVYYDFTTVGSIRRPVVTLGSYDGVHRGHRTILERLGQLAHERDGERVVITFDPHPRTVVCHERVELLSTLSEKLELLASVGVDHTIVVHFTDAFRQLSSRQFVAECLVGALHVDTLMVGYNHHLGHNQEGSAEALDALAAEYGFHLEVIAAQQVEHQKVSSTVIRRMIRAGRMAEVVEFLGAPYPLSGRWNADGTLDSVAPTKLLPPSGSYAVRVMQPTGWMNAMLTVHPDRQLLLQPIPGTVASDALIAHS